MDQPEQLLLAELEDRVEQIFANLDDLRGSIDNGKAKRELLDAIFRNVHSLKAVAGTSGLKHVSELAHEFESLLHSVRVGRLQLDDNVLSVFDDVADALFAGLHARSRSDKRTKLLLSKLKHFSRAPSARRREEVEIALNSLPGDIWQSLNEGERHRLQESVSEGGSLYLVSTRFDVSGFDHRFHQLKQRLTEKGEVISTAPKISEEIPKTIDFRILYTQDAAIEQLQTELSEFGDVDVAEVIGGAVEPRAAAKEDDNVPVETDGQSTVRKSSARYIRINLDDLDRLIASTHTLSRQTTDCLAAAVANSQDSSVVKQLELRLTELNDSLLSLAAKIVDLRMVRIERLLQRAVRSGRAAARAAGKEIDFVIRGEMLMLDKSLFEAIADPLIHLVRNAVDHGIESADERVKRAKRGRGRISIEATNLQGQTRITVSDDGRGIDPALISEAAKLTGVVPPEANVTVEQSHRLIFRPGFSTTGKVSGTSGRGVGLDAVESAVEEVGGAIRVASEAGKGTSFEIQLPVTFGLLEVATVIVGSHKYLIDHTRVLGHQTIQLKDVEDGTSDRRIRVGEHSLRLLALQELLGGPTLRELKGQVALICLPGQEASAKPDNLALIVDRVEETQKVLVRNLGSRGARWFGVAGASELRDGKVALLLDLPQLLKQAS